MINFLDLLFLSASGTIAKSPPDCCTKFNFSRRPSGENTTGPQELELTSAWLMDGLGPRLENSPNTFPVSLFVLISIYVYNTYSILTETVELKLKPSLFNLIKEIFHCRPLALAFPPLALYSHSPFFIHDKHKQILLSWPSFAFL